MFRRHLEKNLAAPPPWLWPLLVPLSLLYAGAGALHRALYRSGILPRRALPRPVVSVGNLTAGGGGKTPVVMWLADALASQGLRPAVLSRGYGRDTAGALIVDPQGPWKTFGDEPVMMARNLKGIPVVVSADRYRGGLALLDRHDVDLFILDDGFQHHALKREMDILTVDDRRRFGNGRVLPAGILREPVGQIRRADLVVVTKAGGPDPQFGRSLANLFTGPVLWADYIPTGLEHAHGVPDGAGQVKGPYLAFCGIADPDGFRHSLDRLGLDVMEIVAFPDHHPYTGADLSAIEKRASQVGARALVTTEKDAVRLPAGRFGIPCLFPRMKPDLGDGATELLRRIKDLVGAEDSGS